VPLEFDDDAFDFDDDGARALAAQRLAAKSGPSGADRAGGALQGGLSGAAMGAKLGSVVPGVGNLIGAGAGALLGAAGGALTADKGQKFDPAGMAKNAQGLADQDFGGSEPAEITNRQPFGAGVRAFEAKTKGGRKGAQSEMGDFMDEYEWDMPSTDLDLA
jgi:hypothetical protein